MRNVDFVLYTSKLCNLRCAYCYELPLLGDKTRMQPAQLDRLFAHAREWLDDKGEPSWVRFQWHGGEPMLIPPDYYWSAFEAARRAFAGSAHQVQHTVQSNFTVLDDARLDLMLRGFSNVGVSVDVRSGLRTNAAGVDQEPKAHANLDRALAAGLKPVGISVLSRNTLPHIKELYAFFRARGMGFRVLPLERGLYGPGQDFEITAREILGALMELADLWFADDQTVAVEPIMEHIRLLVGARLRPTLRVLHDKEAWEPVLSVDTSGQLFGYTNYLDDAHALGNVFTTPIAEIMRSAARARAVEAAGARVQAACGSCDLAGRGCTTYPMAESEVSILDTDRFGAVECSVTRPLLRHLEQKLVQSGVFAADGGLSPAMQQFRDREVMRHAS